MRSCVTPMKFSSILFWHTHLSTTSRYSGHQIKWVNVKGLYIQHNILLFLKVNQCLSELLSACQQYSQVVELDSDKRPEIILALSTNFSRQSSLLFKLLASIRSRQIGTQLSQLLLRIDYNRYFSTHGHDIKTVA